MVSMGAAEVGLHVLHETPELRDARQALDSPGARDGAVRPRPGLLARRLLTWDPNRLYIEERRHDDGVGTLVLTALTRRLLPLVRYDLDDEAELLDAAAANAVLADVRAATLRLERPAVALWGRRGGDDPRRRLEPAPRDRQGGALRHGRPRGRAHRPLPHRGRRGPPGAARAAARRRAAAARHRGRPAPHA